ncbi:MAG TPA: dienelactone hydrolase family protein [Planctomycetota bacterium]|nr:dienelactone hydrolase family protein [Planctomycetota bacterium]
MKNVALLSLFALLAPQDPVQERLEKSPRHHEWVQIKVGERTLHAFVVFPEVKEKAAAIVVIHENKGLNDWARSAADQFAEAGLIAIAPDLLSGLGPNGGKTSDFPSADAATQALYKLPPDQVTADLNACADYVGKLPACNGKVAVGGFCWGGGQTFRFATNRESVAAAYVFYGPAPEEKAAIAKIKAPVYGFYGENDNRINAGIEKATAAMKEAGKTYEPVIYKGAGHGFMRAGEMPNAKDDDKKARADAWVRIKDLLKKL